mmetsp:Transcript_35427/g.65617  ORF Transcript_35427/g.65617 Transcript_35427/m.65617 type:complete len:153 (+) Transcript_35427:2-460(+)
MESSRMADRVGKSLEQNTQELQKEGNLNSPEQKRRKTAVSEGLRVLITLAAMDTPGESQSVDTVQKEENVKRVDDSERFHGTDDSVRGSQPRGTQPEISQGLDPRRQRETVAGDVESVHSRTLDYIHHGEGKKIPLDLMSEPSGYTVNTMHL